MEGGVHQLVNAIVAQLELAQVGQVLERQARDPLKAVPIQLAVQKQKI